jgi:predicted ATPase
MEVNSRINFDFPLTVIVGQNGCGKSSVLHAIYGMPKGKTPYRFWFDTKVDPIVYYDDEKRRHSFWYQYSEAENVKEVVKARIRREENPNYWETSRPLTWAGMSAERRAQPIEKNVVYLDFRSELSAFDKFFYFGNTKGSKARNKQEFIRNKSKDLLDCFAGEFKRSKSRFLNKKVENLSENELKIISFILGRQYTSALSLYHALFRNQGYSVLFRTNHAKYSEAFAGSGEMAVVRLVKEVLNAPEFSLIILDEPEVSLHPGAQKRLTDFLLEEIKKKKHQIILTTHSPAIIQELPKEAIKVLYQNQETGRFSIKENLIPAEAFYHIEFPLTDKKRLHFEDKLAQEIFDSVLNEIGKEKRDLFELCYHPGGCGVLSSEFISVFCRESSSKNYIIFDGDQKFHVPYDWRSFSQDELTVDNLKEKVKELTNVSITFSVDGGNTGGNDSQKIELYKKYLDYYSSNVFYLPENIPEEIIWNTDTAKKILSGIYSQDVDIKLTELLNITPLKERFSLLCKFVYNENTSDMIFSLQKIFIQAWLQRKDENYNQIVTTIDNISS